jgi:hypothetical protein
LSGLKFGQRFAVVRRELKGNDITTLRDPPLDAKLPIAIPRQDQFLLLAMPAPGGFQLFAENAALDPALSGFRHEAVDRTGDQ